VSRSYLHSHRRVPVELTEEQKAKVAALYRDHCVTINNIAKRYGVTPKKVSAILSEHGIKLEPSRRWYAAGSNA